MLERKMTFPFKTRHPDETSFRPFPADEGAAQANECREAERENLNQHECSENSRLDHIIDETKSRLEKVTRSIKEAKEARAQKEKQFVLDSAGTFFDLMGCFGQIPRLDWVNTDDTRQIIGRYQVHGLQSNGKFGTNVLEAQERQFRKPVTIKVIHKNDIQSLRSAKKYWKELHVLTSASHQNILRCMEIVQNNDFIFKVTERTTGSLLDLMASYAQEDLAVKEITKGILCGLEYLHSHRVAHCNLNLENIQISFPSQTSDFHSSMIKLCNFESCQIADVWSNDVAVKGPVGTPGFMPPEVMMIEVYEGRKADMWSVGVLIMAMCLGFSDQWSDFFGHLQSLRQPHTLGLRIANEANTVKDSCSKFFIRNFLRLDPFNRMTAAEAMQYPYWRLQSYDHTNIPPANGVPTASGC